MNDPARPAAAQGADALTLLCIDDEANILNALRRLLRPHGYRVLTAGSGAEGLAVIAEHAVDLVISDMRMPEMDGAAFLEEVKARSPDTARILLTGFADLSSTVAAINKAEIYRYISKPWDDAVVVGVVRDALERKMLERERARLERLTQKQNEELKELNATLESKVELRTAELNAALGDLEHAHEKLKKSFVTSISIFSSLIELREGAMAGRSRRMADLARRLARHMKLDARDEHDVTLAALLHGIGKFGLSDALLSKAPAQLTFDERAEVTNHPIKAQTALMPLEQLQNVGKLIRSYRERHDGMGYPDGLRGSDIPLGARIIAVAHDYVAAQDGVLPGGPRSRAQATQHIVQGRGKRYDPAVVDAFLQLLDGGPALTRQIRERELASAQLEEGMVLSRHLVTPDGLLLLAKDRALDAQVIEQIRAYEKRNDRALKIHVRFGQA